MELVKSNNELKALEHTKAVQAIESLPVLQKSFALASVGARITELEPVDGMDSVYRALKVAEMDSGLTKIHDDDLILLAKTTYDFINSNSRGLTVDEFRAACRAGVLGTYDKWYGICLKTVVQWIEGYIQDEVRILAIRELNKKLEIVRIAEKPTIDKLLFSKQGCVRVFERFVQSNKLPPGAFAYYDILNELIGTEYKGKKTLVTDPEARKRIIEECKKKWESSLLWEKAKFDAKGEFNQAEAIVEALADENNKSLSNLTKAEFLRYFFQTLKDQKKELVL